MSESQFEKLLKTLKEKDAEIERLTSALLHVEQLHSISEARKDAEIRRLRELLIQSGEFFGGQIIRDSMDLQKRKA